MSRYIIKLHSEKTNKDYYMEWSTIVDAPVTYGVDLNEFTKYYIEQYGKSSENELKERLTRVEEKGTSSQIDDNVDDLIKYNRAGENETSLTKEEILNQYCR